MIFSLRRRFSCRLVITRSAIECLRVMCGSGLAILVQWLLTMHSHLLPSATIHCGEQNLSCMGWVYSCACNYYLSAPPPHLSTVLLSFVVVGLAVAPVGPIIQGSVHPVPVVAVVIVSEAQPSVTLLAFEDS